MTYFCMCYHKLLYMYTIIMLYVEFRYEQQVLRRPAPNGSVLYAVCIMYNIHHMYSLISLKCHVSIP